MARLILLFFLMIDIVAKSQSPLTFISRFDPPGLHQLGDQKYNEVWGWYDAGKRREYAILGSLDSIYFVDVTNPSNPAICDVRAGRSKGAINRDFEVYDHYIYCVADEGGASLQIFDLSSLPDSVRLVSDSDGISANAHTVHVKDHKLYICKNKRQGRLRAMDIFSLTNPENPTLLGTLIPPSDGAGGTLFDYVHEVHVINDTAWCACGDGGLFVYNVSDPSRIKLITSLTQYPEKGFCHAVSVNGKNVVMTDENPGLGVKILQWNGNQLQWRSTFRTNQGAVAHSPFFYNDLLYLSAYQDGVYIYDVSDQLSPKAIGWYDTYGDNPPGKYDGLKGCWGVYPYLPSGHVLASDMKYGLYVLKESGQTNTEAVKEEKSIRNTLLFPYERHPIKPNSKIRVINMLGQSISMEYLMNNGYLYNPYNAPLIIVDGID